MFRPLIRPAARPEGPATETRGLPCVVIGTDTRCGLPNPQRRVSDRKGEPYYHAALCCGGLIINPLGFNQTPRETNGASISAPGATQPEGCDRLESCRPRVPEGTRGGEWETPLRQTCSREYPRAQYAFKSLMIH